MALIPVPETCQIQSLHRRLGHITVPYKNYIIVWGGFMVQESDSESCGYYPAHELWFYDCHTDIWTIRTSKGEVPMCTSGSTGIVLEDELYIFGGITHSDLLPGHLVYSNILYQLDICSLTWKRLVESDRQLLSCDKGVGWSYKQRLYFFGGYGMRPADPYYSCHFEIDVSDRTKGWNNQLACYDVTLNLWIKLNTKGISPAPRAAHAADVVGHLVYVFGGRTGEVRNNELYCLNLETMTWSHNLTLDVLGFVPDGRSWHTFNFVSPKRAILYGGLLRYEIPAMDFWECTIGEGQPVQWNCKEKSVAPLNWQQAAFCSLTGDLVIVGGSRSSPYQMEIEDHVNTMVIIHYQPKSLFRLSMDMILKSDLFRLMPEFFETNFPRKLMHYIYKRSSQTNYEN